MKSSLQAALDIALQEEEEMVFDAMYVIPSGERERERKRERERERERGGCGCVGVHACVRACVRVCICVRV